MINKRQTLINLIQEDLTGLNEVALAELYSIEQKLLNGSCLKNLREISADNVIKNFIYMCQPNSSVSTIYNYRKILEDFMLNVKDNLTIEQVLAYIRSKPWCDNTKRRNNILIKRFLTHLFTQKYTESDLSENIKIPQQVHKLCFCPSKDEVLRFISAIKLAFVRYDQAIKYETLFKIYIKVGLRRTELININIEDIDFNNNRMIIRKTKNKDVKIINMDDNLIQILKDYLKYFNCKSGPLFRGVQGNRICKQSLMIVFYTIKEKAGLPKEFKIHSFRRFFINELRKNHIDIVTIKNLAGHRDIRTTEIYCNISEEEKIKAIESIRV